jgi:hypothetical protein
VPFCVGDYLAFIIDQIGVIGLPIIDLPICDFFEDFHTFKYNRGNENCQAVVLPKNNTKLVKTNL